MQIRMKAFAQALLLGLLLGFAIVPSYSYAATALVQTTANPAGQHDGNTGNTEIYILVTNPIDGTPLANLGTSGPLPLPTGWTVQVLTTGAFTFTPITFTNKGNGAYMITAMPPANACNNEGFPIPCWPRGEYHYVIRISVPISGTTYQGSGLGVLVIP